MREAILGTMRRQKSCPPPWFYVRGWLARCDQRPFCVPGDLAPFTIPYTTLEQTAMQGRFEQTT